MSLGVGRLVTDHTDLGDGRTTYQDHGGDSDEES